MSFSHTCDALLGKTKDVTRRLGWEFLEPGDVLGAVEKSRGLKKGQKVRKLGTILVISKRREVLMKITSRDVAREGYPGWRRWQFIDHFCNAFGCKPGTVITRIEFEFTPHAPRTTNHAPNPESRP